MNYDPIFILTIQIEIYKIIVVGRVSFWKATIIFFVARLVLSICLLLYLSWGFVDYILNELPRKAHWNNATLDNFIVIVFIVKEKIKVCRKFSTDSDQGLQKVFHGPTLYEWSLLKSYKKSFKTISAPI